MTLEEAINIINHMCVSLGRSTGKTITVFALAKVVAAAYKQIETFPQDIPLNESKTYFRFNCPSCRSVLCYGDSNKIEKPKFCNQCGQSIKWRD